MEKTETVRERAEELAAHLKERVAPVDHWVRTMARQQPLLVLAGAIGIGYFVGRLLRRA